MLYTVGYLGYRSDEFIAALKYRNVRLVIDVRTSPVSKVDWANGKRLKELLNASGLSYRHYPDLGGRPKDTTLYNGKEVDYDKLIGSMPFVESINRITAGIKTMEEMGKPINIAFMCSERDKDKCHRWLAVAQAFIKLNFDIVEIQK